VKTLTLKSFWFLVGLLPLGAASYSSTQPAAKALIANFFFPLSIADSVSESESTSLASRRKIQQHYLGYGVYVPIDDIILDNGDESSSSQIKVLKNSCGAGKIFVWVPLRFRFPIFGEKVMEWCLAVK